MGCLSCGRWRRRRQDARTGSHAEGEIAPPASVTQGAESKEEAMGVFRRTYPDGRVSNDWYINYRIHGKQW